MKIFHIVVAAFISLLSFLAFTFLALVFYAELGPPFNIIVGVLMISLGLIVSRMTFNLMRRRGVISVMSGDNSSYELDDLEPVAGDRVSELKPEELQSKFLSNDWSLDELTIAIWGDWEGRGLNIRHRLKSIDFCNKKRVLSLKFSDHCLLKIKKPQTILASSTYIKVIHANEILWQVPADSRTHHLFSYLNTGKEITTKSNTMWKPHKYDIGIGMNAIYLQG
jgi:hypothetical protein